MDYCRCDINKHNLNDIAELIYQTEPEFTKMLFGKNKVKGKKRIIKLIKNESNSFSSKNILLANENNRVIGIIIGYSGSEIEKDEENKAISKTIDIMGVLRLQFFGKLLLDRLLTISFKPNDYYISVICVNKKFRRKGIGEALIKNTEKIAKKKKCSRIILDVSQDNTNAIKFYKKNRFRIYGEVNTSIFFHKIKVYKMELFLNNIYKIVKPARVV